LGLSGVQPQLEQERFLNLGLPHWVQNWESLSAPQLHCHTLVCALIFSLLAVTAAVGAAAALMSESFIWVMGAGASGLLCFAFLRRISSITAANAADSTSATIRPSRRPLPPLSFSAGIVCSGLGARLTEGGTVGAAVALGRGEGVLFISV